MGSHMLPQALSGDRDPLAARCGGEERLQKSLEAKAARAKQVRIDALHVVCVCVLYVLDGPRCGAVGCACHWCVSMVTQRQQDMCSFRAHQGSWLDLVPEAPTFYPTLDEFADPLEYIRSLQNTVAAEFGTKMGAGMHHMCHSLGAHAMHAYSETTQACARLYRPQLQPFRHPWCSTTAALKASALHLPPSSNPCDASHRMTSHLAVCMKQASTHWGCTYWGFANGFFASVVRHVQMYTSLQKVYH